MSNQDYVINEWGVAENPEEIIIWNDKNFGYKLTLASNKSGKWNYGYHTQRRGALVGCGGGGRLPWLGKKDKLFDTRDAAYMAGLQYLLDDATEDKKHPNGTSLQKVINKIKLLIEQATAHNTQKMAKSKTTEKPAPFSAPLLQFVKLSDIMPDPNQPRKYFSEVDDKDLLESIRSQGILQALLIRPLESSESLWKKAGQAGPSAKYTKYLIVCGERRFRAAAAVLAQDPSWQAGLIPCQVKSMNDEAALEAQIVENLQRKDVHPMEEALAFAMLAKKGLSQEQIGARVGKGDRFVRARLVLCSLSKAWQDLFLRHAIDLETALKICRYSDPLQAQILTDQKISKKDMESPDLRISVRDFSAYRGDLLSACFDITDPTLNPSAGSCNGCPFNSASANLFPEDAPRPRCMNLACFKIKTDKGYELKMKEAAENPSIILVKSGYRSSDDKQVEALKKKGLKVLDSDEWEEAGDGSQDPGTYEEWKVRAAESNYDWNGRNYDPADSDKSNRQAYEGDVRDWDKKQKEIQAGLKSGKFKMALVVLGDDDHTKGTMIPIEINEKTKSSGSSKGSTGASVSHMTPNQRISAGKAKAADYDAEIKRLEKDIRDTKDRVGEAGHGAVVDAFDKAPISHTIVAQELDNEEVKIMALFLLEEMEGDIGRLIWYDDKELASKPDELFYKSIGLPAAKSKRKGGAYGWLNNDGLALDPDKEQGKKALEAFFDQLDRGKLALIFRRSLLHKYGSRFPGHSGRAKLLRRLIDIYNGKGADDIDVPGIIEAERQKGDKRIERAKARIAELKKEKAAPAKKKEEKKPAAKAKAKPAAKKAAAKPTKKAAEKPAPAPKK